MARTIAGVLGETLGAYAVSRVIVVSSERRLGVCQGTGRRSDFLRSVFCCVNQVFALVRIWMMRDHCRWFVGRFDPVRGRQR